MTRRVLGLGAGGHAKVVIDMVLRVGAFEISGLLDANRALWGTRVCGIPVLGGDDMLPALRKDGIDAVFIGIGSAGSTEQRTGIYTDARAHGFDVISVIDPGAMVSALATIGAGATIMPGAIVNAGARLGENVIVNTGAIVEHDCEIDDHVHVATGVTLGGTVRIGSGAHIGLGASVRQGIRIGRNAIVGAAALVVDDVPDGMLVMGVPARVVREVARA